MPKTRRVRIEDKTIVKSGNPSLIRVEVEKTRRALQIGEETGLFRVPKILDYDETRGVVVFERIFGIEPLVRAAHWGREYEELGERLGASLAAIHAGLSLPSDMIIQLPGEYRPGGTRRLSPRRFRCQQHLSGPGELLGRDPGLAVYGRP